MAVSAVVLIMLASLVMTGCPGDRPSASMSSTTPSPTCVSPIPVTVSFSAWVSGFDAGDIVTSNCAVTNFRGSGAEYQFDLVPQAEGALTASIPENVAKDANSMGNTAAPQFSRAYDITCPRLTLATTAPNPTDTSPIPITIGSTETVSDFVVNDLQVSNGVITGFTGSGAGYSCYVTPLTTGLVTVTVPAGVVTDAAGNKNSASASLSRSYATKSTATAIAEVYHADFAKAYSISPTRSYAPLSVFFEGWKSTPREDIQAYEWNFGDGSPVFSGFNAAHVYETPGTYTATLTIMDNNGNTSSAATTIQVLARNGTTYYVDAVNGNDTNNGTSTATAWKSAAFAFNRAYQPGTQILFRRGQTFALTAGAVGSSAWRQSCGFLFGAYGTGNKPIIQLTGTASGFLFPNTSQYAFATFQDLDFRMTSSQGGKAAMLQQTNACQNIMFLRCDISDFTQGFLFQGDASGMFLVGCNLARSGSGGGAPVHIYSTCSRLALKNNTFHYALSHLLYLEAVDKGVITGNTFTSPPFGYNALRVCATTSKTTNNVVITNNSFDGSKNGYPGQTRDNWLLVQLSPNTSDLRISRDILFENNVVQNAETFIGVGNCENVTVRRNLFTGTDRYEGRRIMVGSKHYFDTMPCKNIRFSENVIATADSDVGTTSIFSILAYGGPAYQGRTRHEDIVIEKNVLAMANGELSRLLWFESDNSAQVAEVTSNNEFIYADSAAAGLYQIGGGFLSGGAVYTLADWTARYGQSSGSQICLSPTTPMPGWPISPFNIESAPIPVHYSGAMDLSGTGIRQIRLWVCKNGGAWQDTGLRSTGETGVFSYTDPNGSGSAVYAFALQAQDNAGNLSPAPKGTGLCVTKLGS